MTNEFKEGLGVNRKRITISRYTDKVDVSAYVDMQDTRIDGQIAGTAYIFEDGSGHIVYDTDLEPELQAKVDYILDTYETFLKIGE